MVGTKRAPDFKIDGDLGAVWKNKKDDSEYYSITLKSVAGDKRYVSFKSKKDAAYYIFTSKPKGSLERGELVGKLVILPDGLIIQMDKQTPLTAKPYEMKGSA